VNKIVPGEDFSKGEELKILCYKNFEIIPLICFEGIFPWQLLNANKLGGNIIINISNEAWFGKSYALYQHIAANVLRSVESGKYFIRCANTGISAIISPKGNIVKQLKPFKKGCIISKVSLLSGITYYYKLGFLFNFLYFIIFNLGLILRRF
jgi:apolipoprotein N-acyltransferase